MLETNICPGFEMRLITSPNLRAICSVNAQFAAHLLLHSIALWVLSFRVYSRFGRSVSTSNLSLFRPFVNLLCDCSDQPEQIPIGVEGTINSMDLKFTHQR